MVKLALEGQIDWDKFERRWSRFVPIISPLRSWLRELGDLVHSGKVRGISGTSIEPGEYSIPNQVPQIFLHQQPAARDS